MTKMLATLLLAVFASTLCGCFHSPSSSDYAKPADAKVSFPDSSPELSKWVRTHVGDYWGFAKTHNLLSPYASDVGIVMGDAHLANFSVLPLQTSAGKVELKYVDIDFDDAGRAPFALDFLRLVIATKATQGKIKDRELTAAYIQGLHGEPFNVPQEISQIMATTPEQYLAKREVDLDGKTSAQGFKFKPGKIETYSGPIPRATLVALVPQVSVVDIAIRPHDSGESAGEARIWILGKDADGARHIFELKKYFPSQLANYAPQLREQEWVEEVRNALWPDIAHGEYELIHIDGNGDYWLREKKLTFIDIPYSSNAKSDVSFVGKLATYDSYVLGRLHGQQAASDALKMRLNNPVEQAAFSLAIKLAAKEYLYDVATRQ